MARIYSDENLQSRDDGIDIGIEWRRKWREPVDDSSSHGDWTRRPGSPPALGRTCQGRTEPVIAGLAGRIRFPGQRTNNFLRQTRQGRPPASLPPSSSPSKYSLLSLPPTSNFPLVVENLAYFWWRSSYTAWVSSGKEEFLHSYSLAPLLVAGFLCRLRYNCTQTLIMGKTAVPSCGHTNLPLLFFPLTKSY